MSTPTFNGTELTSAAEHEIIGGPEVRYHAEAMPGLDGRFVQTHGTGGQTIIVRGLLKSTSAQATAALAHSTVKTLLRTKQGLADGSTVASYVGTDGTTYTNCMVLSYEPAGTVQIVKGGSNYRGYIRVEARILHLTP